MIHPVKFPLWGPPSGDFTSRGFSPYKRGWAFGLCKKSRIIETREWWSSWNNNYNHLH